MEMLGEELSKPAHAAMRHNITGIVEAALRTSASAGEDTLYDHAHSCYWESLISFGRYRDRVHVALMEESSQDQVMQLRTCSLRPNFVTHAQGWGVFALEYRVDGPLVAILDAASHKLYVCTLHSRAVQSTLLALHM